MQGGDRATAIHRERRSSCGSIAGQILSYRGAVRLAVAGKIALLRLHCPTLFVRLGGTQLTGTAFSQRKSV
jgi:hypothetical protein